MDIKGIAAWSVCLLEYLSVSADKRPWIFSIKNFLTTYIV